jgi:GNAT superfamily N-acetyltransferase
MNAIPDPSQARDDSGGSPDTERHDRVQIRPYTPEDAAAIADLSVAAWAPVFQSFEQVLGTEIFLRIYPDWQPTQRQVVLDYCSRETAETWVAEIDGTVAGFIVYTCDAQHLTGETELLAVHPDFQNDGVGTALNDFALEKLKEAGMTLAVVSTGGDPGHAPARRSYEKAGYTPLPIVRYYKVLS